MQPDRPDVTPAAPPVPSAGGVPDQPSAAAAPAAGPFAVARTVLWSFFGVRRRAGSDADVASLTLVQVIVGGIVGALLLIACLVTLVMFVTRT
jgi:hypothetical protein